VIEKIRKGKVLDKRATDVNGPLEAPLETRGKRGKPFGALGKRAAGVL
jgi:hypothetical protein